MRRLFLLRHAKSSWTIVGQKDVDRPLAPRGIDAAPRMARHMVAHDLLPDAVICSPARRTRATLDLVLGVLPRPASIRYEPALYGGGTAEFLDLVRSCDDSHGSLLVIGHNPTMQDAVLAFVPDDGSPLRQAVARKYPTAALAVIGFAHDRWADVAWGTGVLEDFVRPGDLAPPGGGDSP